MLSMNLSCYKWYQSKALGNVPKRCWPPRGVDCKISHGREGTNIPYKNAETSP